MFNGRRREWFVGWCFFLISTLVCYLMTNIYIYIYKRAIGLMSRVFANGSRDRSSISGRVIPKIQNMVLDSALLNTQHYTAWIKGKVEQSRE